MWRNLGKPSLWRIKKNRLWPDALRSARRHIRAWTFCHIWASAENIFLAFSQFQSNLWICVYGTGWSTGCPKKNDTQLWCRINQVLLNGHKCCLYHYLGLTFLHMLVKFSCKIMNIFWDIAFTLNAPIFQFAQILDDRQSTTLSTPFKYLEFQDLFINTTPFKTCH